MKRVLCCFFLTALVLLLAQGARAETRIRLTFTGDVTLGSEEKYWSQESSLVAAARRNGYDYFLKNVKPLFEQDDATIVNLEGVLSDSAEGERTDKTYRFRGPTEFTQILTGSSVEIANLANNHTCDYGERGMRDTQAALDNAGVSHFGTRSVCYFEKDGVRIAFVGLSYTDENAEERDWLAGEIARLEREEGVNATVFVYHGGQEYGDARTKKQEEIARIAVEAGADLVVMHHAHVVQGMSTIDGRGVLFSLGNFCFGGNRRVRAMESLVLVAELDFADDGAYIGQQLTLVPAHVSGTERNNDYQPLLVSGPAARRVIRRVQADTRFRLPAADEVTGIVKLDYLPAE